MRERRLTASPTFSRNSCALCNNNLFYNDARSYRDFQPAIVKTIAQVPCLPLITFDPSVGERLFIAGSYIPGCGQRCSVWIDGDQHIHRGPMGTSVPNCDKHRLP